jgi:hypothetical protein
MLPHGGLRSATHGEPKFALDCRDCSNQDLRVSLQRSRPWQYGQMIRKRITRIRHVGRGEPECLHARRARSGHRLETAQRSIQPRRQVLVGRTQLGQRFHRRGRWLIGAIRARRERAATSRHGQADQKRSRQRAAPRHADRALATHAGEGCISRARLPEYPSIRAWEMSCSRMNSRFWPLPQGSYPPSYRRMGACLRPWTPALGWQLSAYLALTGLLREDKLRDPVREARRPARRRRMARARKNHVMARTKMRIMIPSLGDALLSAYRSVKQKRPGQPP